MPTIKEKLYFNFNGKNSKEFNLIHINTSSGMFEDLLVASRSFNEIKPKGSEITYVNNIENTPLEFELNLAFTTDFSDSDIDNIIRWLYVDYFKPLYFEGAENRIFYCMPSGDSKLTHNGLKQGYFTLTMRCNSAFVYSSIIKSPQYDLSDGSVETIRIFNDGHLDVYPEISILKIGDGNITITNNDNIFEINNLTNMEDIYINCWKEVIITDAIGVSHFDDIIGDFPSLKCGVNIFEVTGTCKIQFKYQFKYRF